MLYILMGEDNFGQTFSLEEAFLWIMDFVYLDYGLFASQMLFEILQCFCHLFGQSEILVIFFLFLLISFLLNSFLKAAYQHPS